MLAAWPEPGDDEANSRWPREYHAAVHPYSGTQGGYVNFTSADDAERAPENYGRAYERLRAVKATYDPSNLFHINQNIPQQADSEGQTAAGLQIVGGWPRRGRG